MKWSIYKVCICIYLKRPLVFDGKDEDSSFWNHVYEQGHRFILVGWVCIKNALCHDSSTGLVQHKYMDTPSPMIIRVFQYLKRNLIRKKIWLHERGTRNLLLKPCQFFNILNEWNTHFFVSTNKIIFIWLEFLCDANNLNTCNTNSNLWHHFTVEAI